MSEVKPLVHIWADGGCHPNPGYGAWAAVLKYGDARRELIAPAPIPDTTNNRMELQAVIEALTALKFPCAVAIHLDSEWVIKSARGEFQRRANLDLWALYDTAVAPHDVTFVHVRGHVGIPENERCHTLVAGVLALAKVRMLR